MRSLVYRGVVVVSAVVLATGAFAAPRTESRGARTVRKIVRVLGDFITIPIGAPAPAPAPKEP